MIKKIPVHHLKKGMYVCGNDRKWLDTPFFKTKFLVTSDEQINALKEYYQFILIDTSKGGDVAADAMSEHSVPKTVGDENDPIAKLYYATIEQLRILNTNQWHAETQTSEDQTQPYKMVSELLPCVKNRLERLLPLVLDELGEPDQARQSVDNCVLGLVLGVRLRFNDDQNKTLGVQLLASNFGADNSGSMEQSSMSSWLISPGDIVEVVSVFSRLRQGKQDKEESSVLAALRCVHSGEIAELKSYLVKKFIESIGVYPAGSVVELNNGQLAVVVEFRINPRQVRLRVVSDAQKKLLDNHQLLKLPGKETEAVWIAGTLAFDDPINQLIIQHCEMVGYDT